MQKIRLAVNGAQEVICHGRFLFVDQAVGAYSLRVQYIDGTTDDYSYLDYSRIVIQFSKEVRQLYITNKHSAVNELKIVTGHSQFHPSGDGQEVVLAGMTMGSMPVAISAPVEIDDSTPVSVAIGAPVEIDDSTPVNVEPTKSAYLSGVAQVVPTTTGATIAANANRRKLIIKASATNTASLWVGGAVGVGLPLSAGEIIELETIAAVLITAENAADIVHALEC